MYRLSPHKYRYIIGVASDDLAVAKDNSAAALADAPIHQADMDGIQRFFIATRPVPPTQVFSDARQAASKRVTKTTVIPY
jgi:hypothetical protein